MIKRVIWDVDGTLLDSDFTYEDELFKSLLSERNSKTLIERKVALLVSYEKSHYRYTKSALSTYLSKELSFNISTDFIEKWINFNMTIPDQIHEGVEDVLAYLESKDIDNVVYSNWFAKTQEGRLEKAKLRSYFGEIYGGDTFIKPNYTGYLQACYPYLPHECLMIGDNYMNDVLGPRLAGLNAIYYDKYDRNKDVNNKIKSLVKIKEML